MKKISVMLLCALMALPALANDDYEYYDDYEYESSYSTTQSDKRDTYVGFRIHRNEHISFKYDLYAGGGTTVRDDNFGFGLNIGNRLTNNVKLEFETMYAGSSVKKNGTDFDFDIWSNMLNVHIYKNFGGAVEPYFGVGVGVTGLWADAGGVHDDHFELSFGAMAGVNFALNKYVDLNLGLRYVDYGKIKGSIATTHIDATEIYIGAVYKFGIFD